MNIHLALDLPSSFQGNLDVFLNAPHHRHVWFDHAVKFCVSFFPPPPLRPTRFLFPLSIILSDLSDDSPHCFSIPVSLKYAFPSHNRCGSIPYRTPASPFASQLSFIFFPPLPTPSPPCEIPNPHPLSPRFQKIFSHAQKCCPPF